MSFEHWDDPRLQLIGKEFLADAYQLVHDLEGYGADATAYLLSREEQYRRAERMNHQVCIPVAFADALMALLLTLPRKGNRRGRRPRWSIEEAQKLVNRRHVETQSRANAFEGNRTGCGKYPSSAAQVEGGKRPPWANYT